MFAIALGCECNPVGSTSLQCNVDGICTCKNGGFFGDKCDEGIGFSQKGNISASRDNEVYSIQDYGPEFYVDFKVRIRKEPPAGWTNILHVSNGLNYGAHGNRYPALFLHSDMYFGFRTTRNDNSNYDNTVNGIKLNHDYHIIISQQYNNDNQLMYTIVIDDEEVHSVENTNPYTDVAQVYLSDPWYPSIGDIGELYDVNVLTNPKRPE